MKYYWILYTSGTTTIVYAQNRGEAGRVATVGDLEVKEIRATKRV